MGKFYESFWRKLKPEYRDKLRDSANKYSTAEKLVHKLKSTTTMVDLTIGELQSMIGFGHIYTGDITGLEMIQGTTYFKQSVKEKIKA